jgi:hypothetical protein
MVRQVKLIIHGGLNPASPLIVIVEFSQLVIQCNWGATHSIHVCLTSVAPMEVTTRASQSL